MEGAYKENVSDAFRVSFESFIPTVERAVSELIED